MFSKLLLPLILLASCMFCSGSDDSSLQVKCRSARYPISIDCSWIPLPSPNGLMPTEFIATYRNGKEEDGESKPCFQPTPSSTSCTIFGFLLFSPVPHVVNVTAIYPGSVSTTLLSFVPEEIIKPDPPVAVRVKLVPGNQLKIQWNRPRTWPMPKDFQLKYHIRYKQCNSKYFWQVGPIVETTYTLKSVQPHAKYCIQVNAQDILGYGEWSGWSLPATSFLTPDNW